MMGNSIRQNIGTSIENLDYNTVCKLTQYVKDSFASIDAYESMKFRIQFNMGDIQLVLEDFDEFCRTAYGQEIDVVQMSMINFTHQTYVYLNPFNSKIQRLASFHISCKDVPTLVNMCNGIESRLANDGTLLRIQKRPKAKTTPTIQTNVPHTQIPQSTQSNITINVGGDFNMSGSAIGSNNEVEGKSSVTVTTENGVVNTKGKSGFWEGVCQQIVANGIWWILGIIGMGIAAYLGLG